VYIDLVAEDTVDEKIARNLRRKKNTAAIVLGDQRAEVEG
jgi:SNF2 family DNA or RNA helicase